MVVYASCCRCGQMFTLSEWDVGYNRNILDSVATAEVK